MSSQCAFQKDGRACIYVKGHGGACLVPEDSQDHSDEIRLRILRDRVEAQEATIQAMRKVLDVFAAAVPVVDSVPFADAEPVYVHRGNGYWLVCFVGAFRAAKAALDPAGK